MGLCSLTKEKGREIMKKQKQKSEYSVEIPEELGELDLNSSPEEYIVEVISPTGISIAKIRRHPNSSEESTLQGYMEAASQRFSNSAYWTIHRQAGYSLRLGKSKAGRSERKIRRFIVRVMDKTGKILTNAKGDQIGLLSTATKSRADKFALILASSAPDTKAEVIDREQQRELWDELRLVLIGS